VNKASVIVPVRNGEPFLTSCIDSLLSQTFEDFELIVIDDGSTDRTDEIFSEYLTKSRRLRKIRLAGRGQTIALNVGLAIATGQYLIHLDADDVAEESRIECQVAFMDQNPGVVACGTAVTYIDPDGDVLGEQEYPTKHPQIFHALQNGETCFQHTSSIARAKSVKDVGGYDESYSLSAEYDLWLKLSQHGELANLPGSSTRKRLHQATLSNLFSEQRKHCVDRSVQNHRRRSFGENCAGKEVDLGVFENGDKPDIQKPMSQSELEELWYRMAMESGNLKTARKYAWHQTRRATFSLQHWVQAAKLQMQANQRAA